MKKFRIIIDVLMYIIFIVLMGKVKLIVVSTLAILAVLGYVLMNYLATNF